MKTIKFSLICAAAVAGFFFSLINGSVEISSSQVLAELFGGYHRDLLIYGIHSMYFSIGMQDQLYGANIQGSSITDMLVI